jgi:hypothetical protein
MSSTGGKSYNETAPFGADIDLTDERQLEAVRTMKRDGSLEQVEEPGTLGERVTGKISDAAATARETASELYDEAREMTRGRIDDVTQGARSSVEDIIERRPLQVLLGAAAAGFLLGRFG